MDRTRIAVVVLFSVASAVPAQEVTEEGFLAALDEGHVGVRSLTDGTARAEGARLRAGTFANPRLDFWREDPGDNPRVTNWTLAWTPPLDGRHGLGKRAAEAGVAAARQRFEVDRAALRKEFRQAFARWSLGLESRGIYQQQLNLVSELAEQARQRARVGEESGLAARRLTLSEGEVRMALGSADAEYVRAAAAARALRQGLPADIRPAPAALPGPPAALDPGGASLLSALQHEREQAEYEARRLGRFVAFPTIQLGWQSIDDRNDSDGGPILAAGWPVPLFDHDRGARLVAERLKDSTEARLSFAQARLAAEVEGGLEAYRTLFTAAHDAREVADGADQVIEAATAAFRAGESGLTDLLDTLRSAFAARLRAIDARGQALQAHRELEAVLGRPLTEGQD